MSDFKQPEEGRNYRQLSDVSRELIKITNNESNRPCVFHVEGLNPVEKILFPELQGGLTVSRSEMKRALALLQSSHIKDVALKSNLDDKYRVWLQIEGDKLVFEISTDLEVRA